MKPTTKNGRLRIGTVVTVPRVHHRGMVVAYGNLLQHAPEFDGKCRVYWGQYDLLTWENPEDVRPVT